MALSVTRLRNAIKAALESAFGVLTEPTDEANQTSFCDAIADSVVDEINTGLTNDTWTTPTLLSTWVAWGAPYSTAGYYKDADGWVHLRGLIKNGVAGTVMFTLPSGYRPEFQQIRITMANTGAANIMQRITLQTDGDVIHDAAGGTSWVSLDGISFRAA